MGLSPLIAYAYLGLGVFAFAALMRCSVWLCGDNFHPDWDDGIKPLTGWMVLLAGCLIAWPYVLYIAINQLNEEMT